MFLYRHCICIVICVLKHQSSVIWMSQENLQLVSLWNHRWELVGWRRLKQTVPVLFTKTVKNRCLRLMCEGIIVRSLAGKAFIPQKCCEVSWENQSFHIPQCFTSTIIFLRDVKESRMSSTWLATTDCCDWRQDGVVTFLRLIGASRPLNWFCYGRTKFNYWWT